MILSLFHPMARTLLNFRDKKKKVILMCSHQMAIVLGVVIFFIGQSKGKEVSGPD